MKQLIIILVVLAVALFIVVGCKGDSGDGLVVGGSIGEWKQGHSLADTYVIDGRRYEAAEDTLPFLNVLKDTTFKLSKMRTFEYFIGEMGNMAARKHLNGEWEIFDCAKALDIVVKTNKQAADEIEKLEAQLDGFRSAYKHDDIRPMDYRNGDVHDLMASDTFSINDYHTLTFRIREKATFNYKYNFK